MARADEPAFVALPYGDNPSFGLTVREWFAGQAMAGIIAAHSETNVALPSDTDTARWAFQYADAMLAQAEKK